MNDRLHSSRAVCLPINSLTGKKLILAKCTFIDYCRDAVLLGDQIRGLGLLQRSHQAQRPQQGDPHFVD
jgi:hypothetical protein